MAIGFRSTDDKFVFGAAAAGTALMGGLAGLRIAAHMGSAHPGWILHERLYVVVDKALSGTKRLTLWERGSGILPLYYKDCAWTVPTMGMPEGAQHAMAWAKTLPANSPDIQFLLDKTSAFRRVVLSTSVLGMAVIASGGMVYSRPRIV